MIRIISIQAGRVSNFAALGREWRSAIIKKPVIGSVRVGRLGIVGDEQADGKHHGGPDKAICCFAHEHHRVMGKVIGRSLQPGAFGENFTLEGLVEDAACLGDQFGAGTALLEISQPRGPCATVGRLHECELLPKSMVELNCTGWYLRVLRDGELSAGAEMKLLQRPHPEWTITRLNGLMYGNTPDKDDLREAIGLPQLSAAWRDDFQEELERT